MGKWLDKHGPKKVLLAFLVVAVFGCIAFALARSFMGLWLARVLCGVGVSACLMAPLTGYRRWMAPGAQLRANSWMLMTGSLGMLSSTLPVQWLIPIVGWRAIFAGLAVLVVLSMVMIYVLVPVWAKSETNQQDPGAQAVKTEEGYGPIWRNAYFWRMAPIGFFCYGGLLALQTLWAAPWMTVVGGYSPLDAATGLFAINLAMLVTFWAWGLVTPRLAKRGILPNQIIAWGQPISFVVLAWIIASGPQLGDQTALALSFFASAAPLFLWRNPPWAWPFRPIWQDAHSLPTTSLFSAVSLWFSGALVWVLTCSSRLDGRRFWPFKLLFQSLACALWHPMFIFNWQIAIIQHDWNSHRRTRTAGFCLA